MRKLSSPLWVLLNLEVYNDLLMYIAHLMIYKCGRLLNDGHCIIPQVPSAWCKKNVSMLPYVLKQVETRFMVQLGITWILDFLFFIWGFHVRFDRCYIVCDCVFVTLSQMFERETRREKILEARHREMKLKLRTKSQAGADKVCSSDYSTKLITPCREVLLATILRLGWINFKQINKFMAVLSDEW